MGEAKANDVGGEDWFAPSKEPEQATVTDQPPTNLALPSPPISETAKLHQVLTWIMEGNSEHLIQEAIESTWPGDKPGPLILKAVSSVKKSAKAMRSNAADWCLEATKFLYAKQVEIGEYAGAMRAVKQIAELTTKIKFPPPQPQSATAVTVVNNVGVQVDADARRTQVNLVAERVRARRIPIESSAERV